MGDSAVRGGGGGAAVRERKRGPRAQVDLMIREAAIAQRDAKVPRERFFEGSEEGRRIRDALWRHVLQFCESGTKVGQSFRRANPKIEWEAILTLRQDMMHDYPETRDDRVREFALKVMPVAARRLKRASFPNERG